MSTTYLNTPEVALLLGCQERSLRDHLQAGHVPGAEQPNGKRAHWRVHFKTLVTELRGSPAQVLVERTGPSLWKEGYLRARQDEGQGKLVEGQEREASPEQTIQELRTEDAKQKKRGDDGYAKAGRLEKSLTEERDRLLAQVREMRLRGDQLMFDLSKALAEKEALKDAAAHAGTMTVVLLVETGLLVLILVGHLIGWW